MSMIPSVIHGRWVSPGASCSNMARVPLVIGCLFVGLFLGTQQCAYAGNYSSTTATGRFTTSEQYPKDRNSSQAAAQGYFYSQAPGDIELPSVLVDLPLLKAMQSRLAIIQAPNGPTHSSGFPAPETGTATGSARDNGPPPTIGHTSENTRPVRKEDKQDDDDPPPGWWSLLRPEGFTDWNQILLEAARTGKDFLLMVALRHGADVNTLDHLGQSPLQLACINLHVSAAILLIEWGASLTDLHDGANIVDSVLGSLLHAQQEGSKEAAASLRTILHYMQYAGGQLHFLEPLMWFEAHDPTIAQTALDQLGHQAVQLHPLSISIQGNDVETVEQWELNALHHAILYGSPEIVQLLCQQRPVLVYTQAGNDPETSPYPLNLAASIGNQAMVYTLLLHGANLSAAHDVSLRQMETRGVVGCEDLQGTLYQSPVFFIFFHSDNNKLQFQAVIIMHKQGTSDYIWALAHSYMKLSGQGQSSAANLARYHLADRAIRAGNLDALLDVLQSGNDINALSPPHCPDCQWCAPTLISLACAYNNRMALLMLLNAHANVDQAEGHARQFMRHCQGLTSAAVILPQPSIAQQYYQNSDNHSVLIFVFTSRQSLVLQLRVLLRPMNHFDSEKSREIIDTCTIAGTLPMLWTCMQVLRFHNIMSAQIPQSSSIATNFFAELQLLNNAYHQQGRGHVSSLEHQAIAFLFFLPAEELLALILRVDGKNRGRILVTLQRYGLIFLHNKET